MCLPPFFLLFLLLLLLLFSGWQFISERWCLISCFQQENKEILSYIDTTRVLTNDSELRTLSLACEPSQRHSVMCMDRQLIENYLKQQQS